mmetsp:Transcript_1243/g.2957  ORF Transcript_1243/g.2957 Transcript_1243/m.2957 type:complete len:249 (-) Transcript_1243:49-795(-)
MGGRRGALALALRGAVTALRPAAGSPAAAFSACLAACQAAAPRLLAAAPGTGVPAVGAPLAQKLRTASGGLPFAARGVSSSAPRHEDAAQPSANPLQQTTLASALPDSEADKKRAAFCHKRKLEISPQKLNEAAKLVRKMHINDALINMEIRGKKSAGMVKDALKSAFANAVNNHSMDPDKLIVAECFVGKGRHLKRVRMHAMGKSAMMKKYRAHLTVKLEESDDVAAKTRVVRPLLERSRKQVADSQ